MNMPWQKIMEKIGNRAGQAVGMGLGAQQLIQGRMAKNRASAATPPAVDSTQAAFLAELEQKRKALNTGAEYTSSLDAISDKMSQTQAAITAASGGDSGGAISGLLRSQQIANRGLGELLAQGQQQEGFYTGMYGDLLNKIAQRKMELGLLSRAQNMAEWAQKSQSGMSNLAAGAIGFMDWKGGDRSAGTPTPQNGMTASSSFGGMRQGVEGFTAGPGQGNAAPLNMGSTNPIGSAMAGGARKEGINLSSLTSKFSAGGKNGGGFDFTSLLSGFGGK